MQFLFVNNRFIKNNFLFHAINKAYEGLLDEKKYPGFFIFLEVDTASIDINIHPNKIEVRFEDEQSLYSVINSTVKDSIIQKNSVVENAQLEKAMIGNHVRYNGAYTSISIGDYSELI